MQKKHEYTTCQETKCWMPRGTPYVCSYPLVKDKIPGSPAHRVTNEELDDIQWQVKDNVVKPNDTSPTPSNAFDCGKSPVGVDSNYSSNLRARKM
jgi:hypothetical protein